ncbi:MAG: hypothetical protein RLZZ164_921 [Actinomycetota bacterium]|jgi:hypothetical protein
MRPLRIAQVSGYTAVALIIVFLAPKASYEIAAPTLYLFGGLTVVFGVLFSIKIHGLANRILEIIRALVAAIFGFQILLLQLFGSVSQTNHAATFFAVAITIWATAATAIAGGQYFASKAADEKRDHLIMAASAALLAISEFFANDEMRNVLGFFSAYLIITQIIAAIAIATPRAK